MGYLLDTNIFSLFLRNNLTIKNKIEQVEAQKYLLAIALPILRLNEVCLPLKPLNN